MEKLLLKIYKEELLQLQMVEFMVQCYQHQYLNPPQSAVLGMHNIVQRPVVVDGKVEARPVMYLALIL